MEGKSNPIRQKSIIKKMSYCSSGECHNKLMHPIPGHKEKVETPSIKNHKIIYTQE